MTAGMWWWVAACGGGDGGDGGSRPDGSPLPTAQTGGTGGSGATHSPHDSGPDPLPDDCDPVVTRPGSTAPADAHQDVFGADPTPFAVHLSLPGSDASVSGAFLWRTDVDTLASVVELGPVGGAVDRLTGASFRYGGVSDDEARIHELKLCRTLAPGTRYQYRVGGDGAFSPWYEFSTPRADARSVRVAFAGDSRGSYLQWSLLLQGMATTSPDLLLFAGDLVNLGTNQVEWDLWFRAGEEVLPRTLLVPAHGNHEFLATQWFAQWALPGNELWFQVRYGPLHLVVLNDTATSDEIAEQATYVEEVLGASDATWKVVLHHQSAYASCSRHGSNLTLRDQWTPAFERAGVDFVIGGHNHVYERSYPLLAGVPVDAGPGITYLVTGGAGAPLYPTFDDEPFTAVALAREHAVVVDLGPDEARFEVRDATGALLDAFTLPADP